jgi:hypothetical protein
MVRIEGYLSGHAIAYWEKSKDSFDLKFLGNRPFDKSIDRNAFWRLAELGQKILESEIVGVIEREAK